MVYTCFLCKWRSDKFPRRSYHKFPTNEELKLKWLQILGKSNVYIGKRTSLCSMHFEEDCFRYGLVNRTRILKDGSLPTLNLTVNNTENEASKSTESQMESTQHQIIDDVQMTDATSESENNQIKLSTFGLEVPIIGSLNQSARISGSLDRTLEKQEEPRLKNKDLPSQHLSLKSKIQQLTETKKRVHNCEVDNKLMNSLPVDKPSASSDMNSKDTTRLEISEVSVEFIKQEPQNCMICTTETIDNYDINKIHTSVLGTPLHAFFFKITNINLQHCQGDDKFICKTCLGLVNEIEQAELEYEKLKQSFVLIIKNNPLFDTPEKTGMENLQKSPEYTTRMDEMPDINNVKTELNDEENISTFSTLVKLEPMSDEDSDAHKSDVSFEPDRPKTQPKRRMVSATPKPEDAASPRKQKAAKKAKTKRKSASAKKNTPAVKFECDICHRQFNQKSNFNRHLTTHSRVMPFECPTCQRRFKRKDHLHAHIRIHTGEKPYECNYCLVKFNQKGSIIKHLRTHTGQLPFECNICQRRFKQRPHLNSHLKTHTGEKPYECTFCKRRFIERTKLRIHMRTHTGERPYECSYCNRQFNQSGNLQSHLRTHTGEKPYECVICSRRFNLKHHLRDHLSNHTGDKAYECNVCKQRFNYKHVMEKHLLVMHPGMGNAGYNVSVDTEPEIVIKVKEEDEIALDSEPCGDTGTIDN